MFIKDAWLVQGKNSDQNLLMLVTKTEMVLEIWSTHCSKLAWLLGR
jgi:hypothetical protein